MTEAAPVAGVIHADPLPSTQASTYPCWQCKAGALCYPGICEECAAADALRDRRKVLHPALKSIPEHYRWARFGAPELEARCSAMRTAKARANPDGMAEFCRRARVVTLIGLAGTGKTSLACAILRDVLDAGLAGSAEDLEFARRSRFFAARDLSRDAAEGPPLLVLLKRCAFAVVDDCGQEAGGSSSWKSDSRIQAVSDALAERHDRGLRTVVTTFARMDAWALLYGGGLARRYLAEGGGVRVLDLDTIGGSRE